jgi:hypothetical protein
MSYYTLPVEHVVLEESDKTMSLTEVQMWAFISFLRTILEWLHGLAIR